MRKILTAFGILLHIFCDFIVFFPIEKYFSLRNAKTELVVGVAILIVCVSLALFVYLVDAIFALIINKSVFNKIKLIMVCVAIPICLCAIRRGNAGFILSNVYSIGLLAVEVSSLFVKDQRI